MSLDLYQDEATESLARLPPVETPEPGIFQGFLRGAGMRAMRNLARAGRTVDALGAIGPILEDKLTGTEGAIGYGGAGDTVISTGTEAQDRYFRESSEVFGRAIDYWTPKPGEVGIAGEIMGDLVTLLPMVIASPSFAVAESQIGIAQDLMDQGLDAKRAQAVGAIQAVGLGTGIWMPILGNNLWQRALIGGAGYNVLQGAATRYGSALAIGLDDKMAEQFKAMDPTALTLDVLLGLAFGGWAHLNPEARAQGKEAWGRIHAWAGRLEPEQVAAAAVARQAQHLNEDSLPGKPMDAEAIQAHVERTKAAVEQVVATGEPARVDDLPGGRFEPDPARLEEAAARAEELVAEGEAARAVEGLEPPPEADPVGAREEGDLTRLPRTEQAAEIGRRVAAQLELTGMSEAEARVNAKLWESFFRTAQEKYGMEPASILAEHGIDIRRLKDAKNLVGALEQATRAQTTAGQGLEPPRLERTPEGNPELIARDVHITRGGRFEGTMVPEGSIITESLIVDPETGTGTGRVTLQWRGDKVTSLLWINTIGSQKRRGMAERTVRAILEHNGPGARELHIQEILKDARPFWEKLGVDFVKTETGEDGFLSLERYRAARPAQGTTGARAGTAAGAGRAGEGQAQAGREVTKKGPLYQSAFHGSPHRFEKFNLQHIGTGEGAQAYAWGHYFSSAQKIADWYRDKLTSNKGAVEFDALSQAENDAIPNWVKNAIARDPNPEARRELAEDDFRQRIKDYQEDLVNERAHPQGQPWNIEANITGLEEVVAALKKLRGKTGETTRPGLLHKVEIPEDDELLNWDIPLSEQPPKVREAIESAYGEHLRALEHDDPIGRDVYHEIAVAESRGPRIRSEPERASRALDAMGIKGVKYRGDTSSVTNYVIWDDNAIEVTETFYQGAPVFYSALARQIDAAKMKQAPAKGWKDFLKGLTAKGAVKADEIKWSGIEEWLDLQQGKVTKEQVQAYLEQNGVKVEEVIAGGPTDRTVMDAAIADDVALLHTVGIEPAQNPDDPATFAFLDRGQNDFVTASEIASWGRGEDANSDITPEVAAAAQRVEDYLSGRAVVGERSPNDTAVADLRHELANNGFRVERDPGANVEMGDAEWGVRHLATDVIFFTPEDLQQSRLGAHDESLVRRMVEYLNRPQEYGTGAGARATEHLNRLRELGYDATPIEHENMQVLMAIQRRSDGRLFDTNDILEGNTDLPQQVVDEVRAVADAYYEVNEGVEQPVVATKFGQYQLPGGKHYREILLTLPHDPEALPKGWRIEEKAPSNTKADIDSLTDEYQKWLRQQALPNESADDLHQILKGERAATQDQYRIDMLNDQMRYLQDFMSRWESASEIDRTAGRGRYVLIGPDGTGRRLDEGAQTMAQAHEQAMSMLDRQGELDKGVFRESHWEQSNVLAHVRFNERTDAEGKRTLFIEEIQSDWAQKGKKRGFVGNAPDTTGWVAKKDPDGYAHDWIVYDASGQEVRRVNVRGAAAEPNETTAIQLAAQGGISRGERVPAAPFVGKTEAWVGLTLKRMIRYAAEHGFERVAWTTGEQQVSRYTSALRKAVDSIDWKKTPEGVQIIGYKGSRGQAEIAPSVNREARDAIERNDNLGFDDTNQALQAIWTHSDWETRWEVDPADRATLRYYVIARREAMRTTAKNKVVDTTEKEDALSDAIGKTMADRIINDPAQEGTIEGEGIRVDDTGMGQFYGKIVPNIANKVLEKLGGGRVGETIIQTGAAPDKAVIVPMDYIDGGMPRPIDNVTRDTYQGAENFATGEPPVYAEVRISINQEAVPVAVVADLGGIQFIGTSEITGKDFTLFLPRDEIVMDETKWNALEAGKAIQWMMNTPTTTAWGKFNLVNGELPGSVKGTAQPSFDITPQMRAEAMKGLPMFQKGEGAAPAQPKAAIQFGADRTLIALFENADRSSFAHETGHFFLEATRSMAARPDAPDNLKADWAAVQDWLGLAEGKPIPTEAHEKFAKGFEAYLRNGQAPTPELKSVFQQFKEWLLAIYREITDLGVELSPEVQAIYDRMLTPEPRAGVPRASIEDTPEARKTVEDYQKKIEAGEDVGPILVDRANPTRVIDGNHRLTAMDALSVPAEIIPVPRAEAIDLLAAGKTTREVADELGAARSTEGPAAKGETPVPPPPRGGEPKATGPEAARAGSFFDDDFPRPKAEPSTLTIADETMRGMLQQMAENEAGWAQIGGRLDAGRVQQALKREAGGMGASKEDRSGASQRNILDANGLVIRTGIPAFTSWIPKAEWWRNRPHKMNEAKVKEAVRKALAGEPLKAKEQDMVDYMVDIANRRIDEKAEIGDTEWLGILHDLQAAELEPTTRDVVDADAVARAVEINEGAVERAAMRYSSDDAAFMAEVRSILDAAEQDRQAPRGGQEDRQAAPGRAAGARAPEEGGAAGEPGAGQAADAVTRAAESVVAEAPDRLLVVGTNTDGTPQTMTAKAYLEAARADAAQAREDAGLFEIAAECLLKGGG